MVVRVIGATRGMQQGRGELEIMNTECGLTRDWAGLLTFLCHVQTKLSGTLIIEDKVAVKVAVTSVCHPLNYSFIVTMPKSKRSKVGEYNSPYPCLAETRLTANRNSVPHENRQENPRPQESPCRLDP
jgi:hypothetical protein